ncbi:DUF3710 domain-containing protein [Tropheryma whipplei]|uniref:DUF3710 domain-containing protein n=1 Tax=Tropheryma whipplei TaxID=2039 RepID=UPI0004B0ACFD|nr:DUF3710 domain-containing protein [Tropheryma whipplei]
MDDRSKTGPFDESEVDSVRIFVDLGGIKVPPCERLSIRLEFDRLTNKPVALGLDYGKSTLQVQPFAAPSNSSLWEDVRKQLRDQLLSRGAHLVETDGALGKELRASIPVLMAGETFSETRWARIVGVDGPRWLLRGVIVGEALTNDSAAAEIENLFRSLVVVRGNLPMPPHEMIPLRMPLELTSGVTQSLV